MLADVKCFSTGSVGWYLTGKVTIRVGDVPVSVQIGLNLTIVGTKELTESLGTLTAVGGKAPVQVGLNLTIVGSKELPKLQAAA